MTLILPDWLVVGAGQAPFWGFGVRVVADRIGAVGAHAQLLADYPTDEVIDASDQIVMPGFVKQANGGRFWRCRQSFLSLA